MAQDNCAVTALTPTPRPKKSDISILRSAAEALAPAYAEWCQEDQDERHIESLIKALRVSIYSDGYKICRELEFIDGIEPDGMLVDEMDAAISHLWSAEQKAVAQWVKYYNITLTIGNGEPVSTPYGTGVVVGRDEDQATYLVKLDKYKESRAASYGGTYSNAELTHLLRENAA